MLLCIYFADIIVSNVFIFAQLFLKWCFSPRFHRIRGTCSMFIHRNKWEWAKKNGLVWIPLTVRLRRREFYIFNVIFLWNTTRLLSAQISLVIYLFLNVRCHLETIEHVWKNMYQVVNDFSHNIDIFNHSRRSVQVRSYTTSIQVERIMSPQRIYYPN